MKSPLKIILLLSFITLMLSGCEVTTEKIELWKGTQNGPKKLAAVLTNSEMPMDLRSKAAVALIEINQRDLFRESFQMLVKSDGEDVILLTAPILGKLSKNTKGNLGQAEKVLSKVQVDAKDGLYLLLEFAGDKSRETVVAPLVEWCIEGNYNIRAMAGYNVRAIAKKVGAPAAEGLATLLIMNQIAIGPIAKLIREINDKKALAKASDFFAKIILSNVEKITENHLIAAAIIGGDPLGDALLNLAINKKLSNEMQRFSLRAFSQAVDDKLFSQNNSRTETLFMMAEDVESYDKFQREETYMTIAQFKNPKDVIRIAKLLKEKSIFWKLVGMRCILRIDGDKQIENVLKTNKLATTKNEVEEIIIWVAKFPALLPKLRVLAQNSDTFTRGIVIYVLGEIGTKDDDLPILNKLANENTKLPKTFNLKTIGEAAKASAEKIQQKG